MKTTIENSLISEIIEILELAKLIILDLSKSVHPGLEPVVVEDIEIILKELENPQ